ncbi:putative ripening-related protein 1 [Cynara cardunculus var. scolymus]|uniref:Barwin-like endoglucanase n=1 Tax=Cynara cardunculus var. scolymus TaxID=59895 RepID=A0A103XKW6_CYNCS|nr:putative ripening-related protein 1 [Cynara cardunculus var. scolymus]KVH92628.1 hypothetical protein Ccrd_005299 [Cynara cardunculus var. scolymus]
MKFKNTSISFLVMLLVFVACFWKTEAQRCIVGRLRGQDGTCNQENDADCCSADEEYPTNTCSPPVTGNTRAVLTLNSFEAGGDGGGESTCDNKYHSDNELIVALSTGWFNKSKRCNKFVTINGNGRRVKAKVVDECDSTMGCDEEHDFQPPCRNNIVDASRAVWNSLGVPRDRQGELDITWSDA